MNLVFDTFNDNLFAWNQVAALLSYMLALLKTSSRFGDDNRNTVSSANKLVKNSVADDKPLM